MEKSKYEIWATILSFMKFSFLGFPLGLILGLSNSEVIAIVITSIVSLICTLPALSSSLQIKENKDIKLSKYLSIFSFSSISLTPVAALIWSILFGGVFGLNYRYCRNKPISRIEYNVEMLKKVMSDNRFKPNVIDSLIGDYIINNISDSNNSKPVYLDKFGFNSNLVVYETDK